MGWGVTFSFDIVLPFPLKITPESGINDKRHVRRAGGGWSSRPAFENGPVNFNYGLQSFDTSSKDCSVGAWNNGNIIDFANAFLGKDFMANREMDCTFDCHAPANQRCIEAIEETLEELPAAKVRRVEPSLHLLPRAPSPRDDTWRELAAKGKKLWNECRAKSGPDVLPPACDFGSKYHQLITRTAPEPRLTDLLKENGNSAGREHWLICEMTLRENPAGNVNWMNMINVPEGVLVAYANFRGYPDPIPENGVEVIWYKWQQSVLQYHKERGLELSVDEADFTGLSSYWRVQISNSRTLAVLEQAFADGKDKNDIRTWTPDDEDEDRNPFWAVLGSDNGKGIIRLLTDHKIELKGKKIKNIQAKYMAGRNKDFFSWANFD